MNSLKLRTMLYYKVLSPDKYVKTFWVQYNKLWIQTIQATKNIY